MACPPATARALKGLSRPSGRRCDRRSRGATTARDTDDASLHGEGQVREDSTPAGETAVTVSFVKLAANWTADLPPAIRIKVQGE